MIDSYWWNFTGHGDETNAETRVKPASGFHYYEYSQTRAQRLESLMGIRLTNGDDNGDGGGGHDTPESNPMSARNL